MSVRYLPAELLSQDCSENVGVIVGPGNDGWIGSDLPPTVLQRQLAKIVTTASERGNERVHLEIHRICAGARVLLQIRHETLGSAHASNHAPKLHVPAGNMHDQRA